MGDARGLSYPSGVTTPTDPSQPQYPYPPPPPYGYPYRPPPWPAPQKGAWIGTIGILMIVVGCLGVFGVLMNFVVQALMGPAMAKLMGIFHEGPMESYMSVSSVLGFGASCALIGAGVGIRKRRAWARTLGIGVAAFQLVALVVGQVMMAIYVYPKLSEAMKSRDPTMFGGAIGGFFGGIIGALFGFAIAIAVLIALTRKTAKEEISL